MTKSKGSRLFDLSQRSTFSNSNANQGGLTPLICCHRPLCLQVLLWTFLGLGVIAAEYCHGSDDNRCGVHCVFLVEQHFRVGNGNFSEVLQAFEPIGPKGISLDAMRRHVESKGLFGRVYESSAHKLLEWSRRQPQRLSIVAHLNEDHFVLLLSSRPNDEYEIKDPSGARKGLVSGDQFSGYFLVVSDKPIVTPGSRWLIALRIFCVLALLGAGVMCVRWLIRRSNAGRRLAMMTVLFSPCVGCDLSALDTFKPSVKSDERREDSFRIFPVQQFDIGDIEFSEEPIDRIVPIQIATRLNPGEITIRTSCSCVIPSLSRDSPNGPWELRVRLSANVIGSASAVIEALHENGRQKVLRDHLTVKFRVVGEWRCVPDSIDFGEVLPGAQLSKTIGLVSRNSVSEIVSESVRSIILDERNFVSVEKVESGFLVKLSVPTSASPGNRLATIRFFEEDQLVTACSVFWRVVRTP